MAILQRSSNESALTSTISLKEQLIEKIKTSSANVAVVGMGYVGLPLAVCVSKIGFNVFGLDSNIERVDKINAGNSYISDITSEELAPLVESGKIFASTDPAILNNADIIVICVPTPLTKNQTPDISYIVATSEAI